MKKAKYTFIFVIFTLFGFILQSCEYQTFINIPLTATLKAKYPDLVNNNTICLESNSTYQSIKSQVGDEFDILGAAIWTKYDSTNTQAVVNVVVKDAAGQELFSRFLGDIYNAGSYIRNYEIYPYIIILSPAERLKVNNALRARSCLTAVMTSGGISPTVFNFALDIRLVVGIKFKVN